MKKEEYETLRAKFLKIFASVPLPLRNEIIVLVEDKPVSWNAAYGDVKQDTDNAKVILRHLKRMSLI